MDPTVSGVLGIAALAFAILGFFRIDVLVLYGFIRRHGTDIMKAGSVINAIIWFVLLILILFIGLQYGPRNSQWVLLVWIMAYSLILSTLSALRDYNIGGRGMIRAIYIVMIGGTAIALIGFWLAYWPKNFEWPNELIFPAVVTIVFLLIFSVLGVYNWLREQW